MCEYTVAFSEYVHPSRNLPGGITAVMVRVVPGAMASISP